MRTNQSKLNKTINRSINDLIILVCQVERDNYSYELTEELLCELISTKKLITRGLKVK